MSLSYRVGSENYPWCDNHDDVSVIIDIFYDCMYICKNQYEIEIKKNKTILRIHEKNLGALESQFFRNGYLYVFSGKNVLNLEKTFPVTPENFDFYIDKFKSLIIFS